MFNINLAHDNRNPHLLLPFKRSFDGTRIQSKVPLGMIFSPVSSHKAAKSYEILQFILLYKGLK